MLKFVEAKKHTSSIVEIAIPEEIWKQLTKNVPDASKLGDPPHITLLYMPELSKDNLEKVKEALFKFSQNKAPIQISITGADKFHSDKDKVPHFGRVYSPQLVELRDELVECLQDIDEDLVDLEEYPQFVPHITLQYAKEEAKLPVVKPITWVAREICLSFKGTEKFPFPLALVTNKHKDRSFPVEKDAVLNTKNLKKLAESISDSLASLGYEAEADKLIEVSEVFAKKKKKTKDPSIDRFTKSLREQLKVYVPYYHLDRATSSIMNLLDDDSNLTDSDFPVDVPESSEGDSGFDGGDMGDGGMGSEGSCDCDESDVVEALGPHKEGIDPHILGPKHTRVRSVQTVVEPTANKATPFMERNYSAELRAWLKKNT